MLVAVAQRTVNVAVAGLDGVAHGASDFARCGLPGTQAQGRDLSASVQLEADVCGSHCDEDSLKIELLREMKGLKHKKRRVRTERKEKKRKTERGSSM